MFTFRYPDCVPTDARTALDGMVLDAEEHFAASNRPVDDLDYAGFDPVAYEARTREERDRATVSLAVSVCDGVARELYRLARPFGWSVDRLTATATMLSDQYLAYTYAQKHSKHLWYHSMPGCEVTLADFAAAVHRELERWPWWPRLQGLIRDLSAQKTKRPADAGARPFFPKRAAWVEAEMKKRRITALNQLKKAEGPDRKTVKRILAGERVSTPVLRKLAIALSHYASDKHGFVTLDDIPKD